MLLTLSFTTESNQALPAALYALTYLVRAGGFIFIRVFGGGLGGVVDGGLGGISGGSLACAWLWIYRGWICVWLGGFGIQWGFLRRRPLLLLWPVLSCLPLDLLAPGLPSFGCCSGIFQH